MKHCVLCGLTHCDKGFDLIKKENDVYFELKTNGASDNYDSRISKFQKLVKHKTNNPTHEVIYACLNDNRVGDGVDYSHTNGFRIITGYKAWKYFCSFSNINPDELILFLRELVKTTI